MNPIPVIAIFDIGKTNKKIFLFDEQYHIVHEESRQFPEINDDDGFPCEDITALSSWIQSSLDSLLLEKEFIIRAVNFSAYGASFVWLDKDDKVICPLYNYLKDYPADIQKRFYNDYGGETTFSHKTASPVLGNLNSGLQLYRMKYTKQELFKTADRALHLPQYVSFLISGKKVSDITSIGCHTGLWDFERNTYHEWADKEGIDKKLAPLASSSDVSSVSRQQHHFVCGVGLHDSSAALIPYLMNFTEPFILLSTGTWNITLNPFNNKPLTPEELQHDCLCYMSYQGTPVKAARFFAGFEHEEQVSLLASRFDKPAGYYKQVAYDPALIQGISTNDQFEGNSVHEESYEVAYHSLMFRLVKKQVFSSSFVITPDVKKIFVDGGFSANPLFMNLLKTHYPDLEIYAATVPQASSLGAALAVHHHWNKKQLPADIVWLKLVSHD